VKKQPPESKGFGCLDRNSFYSNIAEFFDPLSIDFGEVESLKQWNINFTHFVILHSEFIHCLTRLAKEFMGSFMCDCFRAQFPWLVLIDTNLKLI
jgi:hypothetical protein